MRVELLPSAVRKEKKCLIWDHMPVSFYDEDIEMIDDIDVHENN